MNMSITILILTDIFYSFIENLNIKKNIIFICLIE